MPAPPPVMVMGRLAIGQQYQNKGSGKGSGKALLLDAARRTPKALEIAGVAALLVHSLSDQAMRFYISQGYLASPVQPMTLCLRLADVQEVIA